MDKDTLKKVLNRSEGAIESTEVNARVKHIIQEVRENGNASLVEWTNELDGCSLKVSELFVSEDEFKEADKLPEEMKTVLIKAVGNVEKFHQPQIPVDYELEISEGVKAGTRYLPIERVAIYVPRGKGSFPSVLYMLIVPALLAGVKEILICTPPGKDGKVDLPCLFLTNYFKNSYPETKIEVLKSGGAQAISALAYGTESIKSCYKVVGPGNTFVTSAKRQLSHIIDPGPMAGPSESVVIADQHQDVELVARELINEAEHGSDSAALLLTDSQEYGKEVAAIVEKLVDQLPEPRKQFCTDVFSNFGGIIIFSSIQEALDFSNLYGPEHLRLITQNADQDYGQLTNAGEVLIGPFTSISSGNFSIGVNAILPTGNSSLVSSPVGVDTFMKRQGWAQVDREGAAEMSQIASVLAEAEGFPSHKLAADFILDALGKD